LAIFDAKVACRKRLAREVIGKDIRQIGIQTLMLGLLNWRVYNGQGIIGLSL
jgi:hypothetical protein